MLFNDYDEPVVCAHCNAAITTDATAVTIAIESMEAYRTFTIGDAELPLRGKRGIAATFFARHDDADIADYYPDITLGYHCPVCHGPNRLHVGDDSIELEPKPDSPIYTWINSHDEEATTVFSCKNLVLITTRWQMDRTLTIAPDTEVRTVGDLRDCVVNELIEKCTWQEFTAMSYPDDIEYGWVKEVG